MRGKWLSGGRRRGTKGGNDGQIGVKLPPIREIRIAEAGRTWEEISGGPLAMLARHHTELVNCGEKSTVLRG